MKEVILYTKPVDPYSVRAKQLLQRKGVGFIERQLPQHALEMERVSGSTQAPQILIGGVPIGSYEQLSSLELQGKLDGLLH